MNKMPSRSHWRESMSCLIDGELRPDEADRLIAALRADPELREEWISFHLVGDALRSSDVAAEHSPVFCEKVAAALVKEPALLATRPPVLLQRARRMMVPAIAVAASVAVIGFVAVPMLKPTGPAPVQQAAVSPPAAPASGDAAARRTVSSLANTRALDAYLVAHRELTTGAALPRATPYLRSTGEADGR